MMVLDTNVVSELMRPVPSPAVLGWLDAQLPDTLWLTSASVAELLFGIARLPDGARKQAFAQSAQRMLEEDFANRVLAFDLEAASIFADLVASCERAGRPMSLADGQIASICLAYTASLITRNEKDFMNLGVQVVNPWNAVIA
jgi:hypothetical protein